MTSGVDLTHPMVGELLGRCHYPATGSAVTCAVSGGADSLTLLVLAVAAGCDTTAVHVDHGARPGSDAEADLVARVAQRLGAAFRAERITVEPGPNFEARARSARYAMLPEDVLTGHTADDQAETVLLNLVRGAALDGLAGIRPERRPLLALRRADTAALCEALGLEAVVDPTNLSPDHRRNRVRHELIPLLDAVAEREVVPVIARQASLLRDAADHLAAEAAGLDPTDAKALSAAPLVLARIAVRTWIQETTRAEHPVGSAAVERVLDVAAGRARGTDVVDGWRVRRSDSRLRLERN
jgi:tRNA(Ile)-lysidine synthase